MTNFSYFPAHDFNDFYIIHYKKIFIFTFTYPPTLYEVEYVQDIITPKVDSKKKI